MPSPSVAVQFSCSVVIMILVVFIIPEGVGLFFLGVTRVSSHGRLPPGPRVVEVMRSSFGFGFVIGGRAPVKIMEISPGGPAALQGWGLRLDDVNGVKSRAAILTGRPCHVTASIQESGREIKSWKWMASM